MTSIQKMSGTVLEICHIFADYIVLKQNIYCLFLRIVGGGEGDQKLVIFCGRHKRVTPNLSD